jgi:hypothetical protein
VSGPLAEVAGSFGEALAGKGYSPRSAGELMRLAAKLSWWLQSRDLGTVDVTAAVIEEFFAERRGDGCVRWRTFRSLGLLAECMVIAPGGTAGGLLARYRDYLLAERGLAASTTDRYLRLAAAFWPQPGDPLRDQPAEVLVQASLRAAEQAAELDNAQLGGLAIDTDGRSPDEAAVLISHAAQWPSPHQGR